MKFKYSAIYQCRTIDIVDVNLVVSNVLLSVFDGPKKIDALYDSTVDVIVGESIQADVIRKLDVPAGRYIQLTVSSTHCNADREEYCSNRISQAVLNIGLEAGFFIFRNMIYKGWISDLYSEMKFSREYNIISERPRFDNVLMHKWQKTTSFQNNNEYFQDKIFRMARYYTKAIARKNDEEKFLYLWTVLEIWPMADTSNIRPISDQLSDIIKISASEIKIKLSLAQLCQVRGDLIHNGYLPIRLDERDEIFKRLENICLVFLNKLSGIAYNGALDEYLVKTS